MTRSVSTSLRVLAVATATMLAGSTTAALAGKLERGYRNVSPIFEPGAVYGEISGAFIFPEASGSDSLGNDFGDFYQRDTDVGAAIKVDLTKNLSTAFIFDEPFGADIKYDEAGGPIGANPASPDGTFANLTVLSFTSITRYKFNDNFSIYGGPRAQRAEFTVGLPFFPAAGYVADSNADWGFGWVAGMAVEIPKFKARASLTYHSEVQHEWRIRETALGGLFTNEGRFSNQTPQGVDFDFRFPVSQTTLIYGNIHWADFSETALIVPSLPTTPILEYNGDNWAATIGVAQRIRKDWVLAADLTYEWESGEDTTPFRTADGEFSIGVASRHEYQGAALTIGAKYKFIEENDANPAFLPGPLGLSYGDHNALIIGAKVGFNLLPSGEVPLK